MSKIAAIFGSSGAIGNALAKLLSTDEGYRVHCFSRQPAKGTLDNTSHHQIDYLNEDSLADAASEITQAGPLDRVIVATGILHQDEVQPEKSLRAITADNLEHLYLVNTIVPTLIAKHFIPKLSKEVKSEFAVLSARPGSIADNQMGGWYAYRASKAALNMLVKNAAIETARRNKNAVVVALHPGVVDSDLSKPFQKSVPEGQLFTADYAASKLIELLSNLSPDQSGRFFAWDGEEIAP